MSDGRQANYRQRKRMATLMCVIATLLVTIVGVVAYQTIATHGSSEEQFSAPYNQDNPRESELVLLHLIFRHGHRAPIDSGTYPLDPYANETFYPYGRGQLLKEGYKKSYELGVFLRRRYDSFLGDILNASVASVRSSSKQRCRDSAALVMAGMFPPPAEQQWGPGLGQIWHPFTADSVPFREDNLLATADSHCPLRKAEAARVAASAEVAEEDAFLSKDKADFYAYLTQHTGRLWTEPSDMPTVYDALQGQSDHGLTLPEWARSVYPEPLRTVATYGYYRTSYTPLLRRLLAGPILNEVLNTSRQGARRGRRLFAYSTHDNVILAALQALNATDPKQPRQPPFCALLAFELHRLRETNELAFKVIYRDNPEQPPRVIEVPGCSQPLCPIERFAQLLQYYIISQHQQRTECESDVL